MRAPVLHVAPALWSGAGSVKEMLAAAEADSYAASLKEAADIAVATAKGEIKNKPLGSYDYWKRRAAQPGPRFRRLPVSPATRCAAVGDADGTAPPHARCG